MLPSSSHLSLEVCMKKCCGTCQSKAGARARERALPDPMQMLAEDSLDGPVIPVVDPEPDQVVEDVVDPIEFPEFAATMRFCGLCRRGDSCDECGRCAKRATEATIPVSLHREVDFDDYVEPELDGNGDPVPTFTDVGIM